VKGGPARVLESLRRAGSRTASGEALSAEQGVSRAQVWKHVETLRSLGYGIEATPGDGYRLVELPDRLYPEEIGAGLETRWLAREIHYFEDTDSTNRVALELARSGAAHGTTVVAEGQSAGRGRLGRSFFSPPHLNLYASIVLRPQITTAEAPTWILAAAVGVARAVEQSVPDPEAVEIKWPNDVLLGGLKTSGILMELGAEATRVAFLVLGIGVNLNVDRSELPEEFRHLATSLSSHGGQRVDRVAFTRRLFRELEGVFDRCAAGSFESVRPDFESRFRMAGRPVTVAELGGERITGVALGIDDHGALRLESARGEEIRVIAGDVTVAKESP
jgi:BirA family biotin operon repressor/biotin-[acetyl-CoA-carboxylase] ligase